MEFKSKQKWGYTASDKDLTLSFLRALNPKYTTFKWFMTAGGDHSLFSYYVQANYPNIYAYFKNNIDYRWDHLGAALDAMQSSAPAGFVTNYKSELASWGGDLQTVGQDAWKIYEINRGITVQNLQKELIKGGLFGYGNDSHFSYNDLIQDVDARNISYYYLDEGYSVSMGYKLYTNRIKKENRFRLFILSYGNGNYDYGLKVIRKKAEYLMMAHTWPDNSYNESKLPLEYQQMIIDLFMEELEK